MMAVSPILQCDRLRTFKLRFINARFCKQYSSVNDKLLLYKSNSAKYLLCLMLPKRLVHISDVKEVSAILRNLISVLSLISSIKFSIAEFPISFLEISSSLNFQFFFRFFKVDVRYSIPIEVS